MIDLVTLVLLVVLLIAFQFMNSSIVIHRIDRLESDLAETIQQWKDSQK